MPKSKLFIHGYTIIELLVAAAIISIIAVFSTQILFDTLTTRSKQNSIIESDENMRKILNDLSSSVIQARSINVPNSETLEITIASDYCRTIKYFHPSATEKYLALAEDHNDPCNAHVFNKITPGSMTIDSFSFSPTGTALKQVNVSLKGTYKDTLNSHEFSYQTTLVPRIKS